MKRAIAVFAAALASTAAIAHAAGPTFPGANGRIAFGRYTNAGGWRLLSTQPDGSDPQTIADAEVLDPAFSPDGGRITYTRFFRRSAQVFVAAADGTGATQVTSGRGYRFFPKWSHDGTRIVYQKTSDLETDSSLHVIAADGSGHVRLTATDGTSTSAEWSPDGSAIAFMRQRSSGADTDIWLVDPDGTDPRRFSSARAWDYFPTWAPSGDGILFTREDPATGRWGIFLRSLAGDTQQLTRYSRAHGDSEARFSPDGSLISFRRCGGTTCGLWVMGPDGSGASELVARGFDGPPAVWAPDSSAIAFSKLAGSPRRYDAFVVDLEGALTRLTDTRAEESVESWQAVPAQ